MLVFCWCLLGQHDARKVSFQFTRILGVSTRDGVNFPHGLSGVDCENVGISDAVFLTAFILARGVEPREQ